MAFREINTRSLWKRKATDSILISVWKKIKVSWLSRNSSRLFSLYYVCIVISAYNNTDKARSGKRPSANSHTSKHILYRIFMNARVTKYISIWSLSFCAFFGLKPKKLYRFYWGDQKIAFYNVSWIYFIFIKKNIKFVMVTMAKISKNDDGTIWQIFSQSLNHLRYIKP